MTLAPQFGRFYTGRCHLKSSHRMLPSCLGVGGSVQCIGRLYSVGGRFGGCFYTTLGVVTLNPLTGCYHLVKGWVTTSSVLDVCMNQWTLLP